jgi:putative restriction endonuclease
MFTHEDQIHLRLQAFAWLEERMDTVGWISKTDLLHGFEFRGARFPLIATQQGIHNPKELSETLAVVSMHNGPYDDQIEEGLVKYKFAPGPLESGYNKKLLEAYTRKSPIIFYQEARPGIFVAYPHTFIKGINPDGREFLLDIETSDVPTDVNMRTTDLQKEYVTREIRQRMHQPKFRANVVIAYKTQCAVCRLQIPALLDAAHIIPDSDSRGTAEVNNGLALCKIHHAAYDRAILGITPDFVVKVRPSLLGVIDGPMLKHGIQELNDTRLTIPSIRIEQPKPEYLEVRFREFLTSSSRD